jgi:hypothetical protein
MFLKKLESWPERGQIVPFLREKSPRKKCTPNIGANIGAITGILLIFSTIISYLKGISVHTHQSTKLKKKSTYLVAHLRAATMSHTSPSCSFSVSLAHMECS